MEISSVKADLLGRELLLNVDISSQFVIAPLSDSQKQEAKIFEKGKFDASGFHFVQNE